MPVSGAGLPGVLRTAADAWLVAHHTGFALTSGRVGMLPLGLVVLPGALLWRAGAAVARATGGYRLRHAGQTALAIAVPYTVIAELCALLGRTSWLTPSAWQAPLAGFTITIVAAGIPGHRDARGVCGGGGATARCVPGTIRPILTGVASVPVAGVCGWSVAPRHRHRSRAA